MSQQVKVGVFALATIAGIFATYYLLTNFSLKHSGYTIAVHFRDVGGLQPGSSVQLSGVIVGTVSEVRLLPDQTVDVICTIVPETLVYRDSRFLVATTLTGQATLVITPPHPILSTSVPLQPGILPEEQQPVGVLPPSITDLAAQGQGQLKELSKTLATVNQELPRLARKFDAIANHTDALVSHSDASLQSLAGQLNGTVARIDEAIATTRDVIAINGRNVEGLTGNLNQLVLANQAKVNELVGNLVTASANLNQTIQSVGDIARDPRFHSNLIETTENIKDASQRVKKIADDIESLTGDPQVQSQLRGAVFDLSSAIAKANDILGAYSTAQAHGPPNAGGAGPPPGGSRPGQSGGSPAPGPSGAAVSKAPAGGRRFSVSSLYSAHVRETFGQAGGPTSDLNVELFPHLGTHLTVGANDLGYKTTYNALINSIRSPRLQLSGGVLYSNLGGQALYRLRGPFTLDARVYDPKHIKMDLYGDLRLNERLQVFFGQRGFLNQSNKTAAFGFQANY
jgi:phospholipid/cholesterol/gamma-HCH transport system substrate-binding protein